MYTNIYLYDLLSLLVITSIKNITFFSEPLCPAIITDLSYNGTFVNNEKIGKGNCRVLDNNDEIAVTHPIVKSKLFLSMFYLFLNCFIFLNWLFLFSVFIFKDLLKNEQDQVPKEISKKYYISRTLGQGACGLVKLVYDKVHTFFHY